MPARRTRPARHTPDRTTLDEIRQKHPLLMAFVDALEAAPTIPIHAMRFLDVPDVNFKSDSVEILYPTEGGELKRRTEPVSEALVRILRVAIGDRVTGPVFLSPFGGRFSSGSLRNLWPRACRDVGLNGKFSFRDATGRRPFRNKTNPASYT